MPLDDTTRRERNAARMRARWQAMSPEERFQKNARYRDVRKRTPAEREYNKDYHRKRYAEIRAELLAAYGHTCACCGDTHREFLTLDHINGDGGSERMLGKQTSTLLLELRAQGWPQGNHRLLCWNCNFARGHYGYCPHQITDPDPGLPA